MGGGEGEARKSRKTTPATPQAEEDKFQTMVSKALLQLYSRNRGMEAATYNTFLVPREGVVAQALREAGQSYAAQAEAKK